MAQKKYRVHEVGKDFNVKSTDVLELLKKYFDDDKNNHMKVLSDEELDIIFETYTQREGFGSLPEYFATYVPQTAVEDKKAGESEKKILCRRYAACEQGFIRFRNF